MRIALTDVAYSYGSHRALDGVSLPPSGGVVGVLGPNGSGKSTLMKVVAGILPGSGRVEVTDGDRAVTGRRLRSVLGCVPQDPPGDVALSVLEAVLVGLRRRAAWRTSRAEVDQAMACLDELGIAHLADRYLGDLSGGQRQLAGLAQMTVRRPSVMLLDEPTSALDLHHQVKVLGFVRERTHSLGGVTLMPMHDLNLAARYCDRLLVMRDGRTVCVGSPEEVLTPETLATTYRVEARVLSDGGVPVVTPHGFSA